MKPPDAAIAPIEAASAATFAPLVLAPLRKRLGEGEGAEGRIALGVTRGDSPLGAAVASLSRDGLRAEVFSLVVVPGERRRGLGTALLAAVEAEARARGARTLALRYATGKPSSAALLRVLEKRGFGAPRPSIAIYKATRDEVAALPWLAAARLPSGFAAFAWCELAPEERAALEARPEADRWWAPSWSPFQREGPAIDASLSLGLRRVGEPLGWVLLSPALGDSVLVHTFLVRRDLQSSGLGIALCAEAVRRALARPEIARYELTIDPANGPMSAFVERHVAPHVPPPARQQLWRKALAAPPRSGAGGFETLIDLLDARAAAAPDRATYTFLPEGEVDGPRATLANGALLRRAGAIAAALGERLRPGDRALLLYPPGLEFVAAFFGCLRAGAIAVPANPPANRRHGPRLRAILGDSGAAAILTTARLREPIARFLEEEGGGAPAPPVIATDEVPEGPGAAGLDGPRDGERPALLQYTSGSTREPRGVIVTHRNLLENLAQNARAGSLGPETRLVSWLPHFHDFGLIANVLLALHAGGSLVLMPPAEFLKRPARWLEAITRERATFSTAPNFAYDLCARRVSEAQRARLDLRSWEIAVSGAEAVRAATLERFAAAFAPCGFRPAALMPCYGLAEATLTVTWGRKLEEPRRLAVRSSALERGLVVAAPDDAADDRTVLVGCGRPQPGTEIRIVDPGSGRPCGSAEVGEIRVAGPSVAAGYWNRAEEAEQTFASEPLEEGKPFLRTGDLGFLRDGDLFVTGRVKEVLIVRGRNHYPQDIEATVEASHEALRPDASAAFSIEAEGEERLAVVAEVERAAVRTLDAAAILAAVREAVVDAHDLALAALVLVGPAALPRTTSGKTRRGACREELLRGSLESVLHAWRAPAGADRDAASGRAPPEIVPPATGTASMEAWLRAWLGRRLGVSEAALAPDASLAARGLDSLAALELTADLEAAFGLAIAPTLVRDAPTIKALATGLALKSKP